MPCLLDAQIHVGTEDCQGVPDNVLAFGKAMGISVHSAEGRGHMLGEGYVRAVLD